MTSLLTQPQLIKTAARNVAEIRSAIGAANAAAAGPTTGVAAAAADEVSAAAAKLFGSYAQEYQAVLNQASIFHEDFAAALASAGDAYVAPRPPTPVRSLARWDSSPHPSVRC